MKQFAKSYILRSVSTGLMLSVMVSAFGSMAGCYREVVSKKGLTVDARHPRQAKSSETKIDKAIDKVIKEIEN